jgi:hypothetical protein
MNMSATLQTIETSETDERNKFNFLNKREKKSIDARKPKMFSKQRT